MKGTETIVCPSCKRMGCFTDGGDGWAICKCGEEVEISDALDISMDNVI